MIPIPLILLALSAASLAAKHKVAKEEEKYSKKMEEMAKKQERRAALSRATGYDDPSYSRRPEMPELTNWRTAGGVADVLAQTVAGNPDGSQAFLNKLTPKKKTQYGVQMPEDPYQNMG